MKKPSSRNFGRWFRFYEESLNDPKIISLTDRGFRTWVNLLSIASKNSGALPCMRDLSVHLRMTHNDVDDQLNDLINAGLIDIQPDRSLTPHNWEKRQFKWDAQDPTTKDRSKRYRAKKKTEDQPAEAGRHGRVTVEVTETPSVSVSSTSSADISFLPRRKGTVLDDRDVPVAAYGHAHTDGHGCEHGRACHDADADRQAIVDEMLADAKQRRREGQP